MFLILLKVDGVGDVIEFKLLSGRLLFLEWKKW